MGKILGYDVYWWGLHNVDPRIAQCCCLFLYFSVVVVDSKFMISMIVVLHKMFPEIDC